MVDLGQWTKVLPLILCGLSNTPTHPHTYTHTHTIAADIRNVHKGHGEHSAETVNNRRHTIAGKVPPPAGMQKTCNKHATWKDSLQTIYGFTKSNMNFSLCNLAT